MKQITFDVSNHCEVTEDTENRIFDYALNNKRAKSKLLKGAMRGKHLVVEKKIGCVNLIFSDGSYFQTVLPLLRSWNRNQNEKLLINETEVEVIEIDSGIDSNQKHVDTKLVILANNCRLVLHAYNSKQKIMVQGENYEKFALNCLEPFFKEKIDETIEQITKINEDIKESFDRKKEFKIDKTFNCPQCEIVKRSNADLKVHIKSCHTNPCISSPPRHKVQKVLQEDLSISALDEKEILDLETEETHESQLVQDALECKWESCNYTTKDKNDVVKHFDDVHMVFLRNKYLSDEKQNIHVDEQLSEDGEETINVDDKVSKQPHIEVVTKVNCNACELETKSCADMEEHRKNGHVHNNEEPDIALRESIVICGICAKGFATESEFGKHSHIHATEEVFECLNCKSTFKRAFDLRRHNKSMHGGISRTVLEVAEDIVVDEQSQTWYECTNCDFVGNQKNMKKHKDTEHPNLIQCKECGNSFPNIKSLDNHIKLEHNIEPFPCEICGLVLADFLLLQEHMKQIHSQTYETCPCCNFPVLNEEEMQTHLTEEHKEYVMLHTMAKQVNDFSKVFPAFQAFNNTFITFETFMADIFTVLKSLHEGLNTLKQEVFVLRNNQHIKTFQNISNETKPQTTHFSSNPSSTPVSAPQHLPQSSSTPTRASTSTPRNKSKILMVGDSITKSLDTKVIEKATEAEISKVKAYGSVRDEISNIVKHAAKLPHLNYKDVVHSELAKAEFDTLVIQAGSVDITNLKTKDDATKHFEYFNEEVNKSAKNQNLPRIITQK